MLDITVKVPEDRVAEFYSMYGRWLAGDDTTESPEADPAQIRRWTSADEALARELWAKFNDRARALFSVLLDNPHKEFSGQELADLVDIPNGANGVAGVLAWPGRYCRQAHRNICWSVGNNHDGSLAVYWMDGVLADLFGKARRS
ncbi:DUF6416 domain-containing protein [Catenuloplanes japonicus]|uniref:DUF6416 domain-containing protein n=1 Tax=Catenuloplanes japonicus TaxID=33876 RepID=UPI000527C414|nr:DUF6416 domain-containing protein [Catenuloplanes japonicus]